MLPDPECVHCHWKLLKILTIIESYAPNPPMNFAVSWSCLHLPP